MKTQAIQLTADQKAVYDDYLEKTRFIFRFDPTSTEYITGKIVAEHLHTTLLAMLAPRKVPAPQLLIDMFQVAKDMNAVVTAKVFSQEDNDAVVERLSAATTALYENGLHMQPVEQEVKQPGDPRSVSVAFVPVEPIEEAQEHVANSAEQALDNLQDANELLKDSVDQLSATAAFEKIEEATKDGAAETTNDVFVHPTPPITQ